MKPKMTEDDLNIFLITAIYALNAIIKSERRHMPNGDTAIVMEKEMAEDLYTEALLFSSNFLERFNFEELVAMLELRMLEMQSSAVIKKLKTIRGESEK